MKELENIRTAADVRKAFTAMAEKITGLESDLEEKDQTITRLSKDVEAARAIVADSRAKSRPMAAMAGTPGSDRVDFPDGLDDAMRVEYALVLQAKPGTALDEFQKSVNALQLARMYQDRTQRRHPRMEKIARRVHESGRAIGVAKQADSPLNTETAGFGLEWVPLNVVSSRLQDLPREQRPLAGQFQQVELLSKTTSFPRIDRDVTVYAVNETTDMDAPNAPPWSRLGTQKSDFPAKKVMGKTGITMEEIEDSVPDASAAVTQNLLAVMWQSLSDACINGQVTNDIDPGNDGVVVGDGDWTSDSPRVNWPGLRKVCDVNGWLTGLAGAGTNLDIQQARLNMREYGSWDAFTPGPCIMAASIGGYSQVMALNSAASYQEFGPQFARLPGELATIWGLSIVPSMHVPETSDQTNTEGQIDATPANNIHSNLIIFNAGIWALGTRRAITLEADPYTHKDSDVIRVISSWRGYFGSLAESSPTAKPTAWWLYDFGVNTALRAT